MTIEKKMTIKTFTLFYKVFFKERMKKEKGKNFCKVVLGSNCVEDEKSLL